MKRILLATLAFAGLCSAASAELGRYQLTVVNNSSDSIKHIYARNPDTNQGLGDRLVGKIIPYTSARIDLSNSDDLCRLKLVAVTYDGRSATKTINVCRTTTWTINNEGELDD